MNMNMGGEPKQEEKSVEQTAVETPHVNPYMEREEREKTDEYLKSELEKLEADFFRKTTENRSLTGIIGEDMYLKPVESEKWMANMTAIVKKMRSEGETEETIGLFIEHSARPEIKIESDHEKEKREVETMLADFEKKHSLEYLYSVEAISPDVFKLIKLNEKTEADQIEAMLAIVSEEDAVTYKKRASARRDIFLIAELMKKVYGKEFYQEESYRRLSNAVGSHNSITGKIRHD